MSFPGFMMLLGSITPLIFFIVLRASNPSSSSRYCHKLDKINQNHQIKTPDADYNYGHDMTTWNFVSTLSRLLSQSLPFLMERLHNITSYLHFPSSDTMFPGACSCRAYITKSNNLKGKYLKKKTLSRSVRPKVQLDKTAKVFIIKSRSYDHPDKAKFCIFCPSKCEYKGIQQRTTPPPQAGGTHNFA